MRDIGITRNTLRPLATPLWSVLVTAVLLTPAGVSAQRTGVLDPGSDTATVRTRAAAANLEAVYGRMMTIEQRREFALLVHDPSLTTPVRASAWTATFLATTGEKEAKVQLNLCDLNGCTGQLAYDITLAGPVDDDGNAELADLDGLVGDGRIEVGGSWQLTDAAAKPGLSWRAVVGYPRFAYRDRTTLEEIEVSRVVYSGTAGLTMKGTRQALYGNYRYERAYKENAAQSVCTPAGFGPAGTTTCGDMIVGSPAQKDKHVARLEYRRSFNGTAAVSIVGSYDLRGEVAGFELPVYIVPNTSGGLSGGLRFGYRTDTKRFTASLFVSEFKL